MTASSISSTATPYPAGQGLRRILLKLSGEALMGDEDYGIDPKMIQRVAGEIREVMSLGLQVAVVIGAGISFAGRASPTRAWIASRGTTWECWPP